MSLREESSGSSTSASASGGASSTSPSRSAGRGRARWHSSRIRTCGSAMYLAPTALPAALFGWLSDQVLVSASMAAVPHWEAEQQARGGGECEEGAPPGSGSAGARRPAS